jgi:hypothetical protein
MCLPPYIPLKLDFYSLESATLRFGNKIHAQAVCINKWPEIAKRAPYETGTRIHMSVEFNSIQPRETTVRLNSGCTDLDHVETFNVSAEAQAAIDREYIKFLEAKNASLKNLCAEATISLSLAAFSLNRARSLLQSANNASYAPSSTSPARSNGS